MPLNSQQKHGMGTREVDIAMSFPCTTSTTPFAPDRVPLRLIGTTVTYSATGIYTIAIPGTFTKGLAWAVICTPQADSASDKFCVMPVGEVTQVANVMTVVLQCLDFAGSAVAPAAATGTRINLLLVGNDSGGA